MFVERTIEDCGEQSRIVEDNRGLWDCILFSPVQGAIVVNGRQSREWLMRSYLALCWNGSALAHPSTVVSPSKENYLHLHIALRSTKLFLSTIVELVY